MIRKLIRVLADGDIDVVTLESGILTYYQNEGIKPDGASFIFASTHSAYTSGPSLIALADCNNDSFPDLLTFTSSGTLSVVDNLGNDFGEVNGLSSPVVGTNLVSGDFDR